MGVYYGRQTPNQMKGEITRPSAGLNSYSPSIAINDNYLSDVLDAEPYREQGMILDSEASVGNGWYYQSSYVDGNIVEGISVQGGGKDYALLVVNKANNTWFVRHTQESDLSVATYALTGMNLPVSNLIDDGDFHNGFIAPWVSVDAGSPAITANGCVFTATAENGYIRITMNVTSGKTYTLNAKINQTVASSVQFSYGKSGQAGTAVSSATGDIILSLSVTANSTGVMNINFIDLRASTWTPITVYWVNVTNATPPTRGLTEHIPYMLPMYDMYNYSSCRFNTEAIKYICFSCEYTKAFIYFDTTNLTVGSVALPFYPKKIISHTNRIFAIDTVNKIWWCRAGDMFSWYSLEYDDDRLVTTTNMANVAYTIAAQPDVPRPATVTSTAVDASDTLGIVTFVGTNSLDQPQTEIITPVSGQRVQGVMSFKSYTTITGSAWTISGGNDTIIIGVAPVSSGYVQDDAGYWTIEKEMSLTDFCVLSENLYIFSPDNIYIFRGFSPDTFSMSPVVNIGINEYDPPYRWLTVIGNKCYFYNSTDIYEFDGVNYPHIISHPVTTNGATTNGIMGGIPLLVTKYNLASDNNNLYVYDGETLLFGNNFYFKFDTGTRTWWKLSGFSKYNSIYSTTAFKVLYLPSELGDSIVSFVSVNTAAGSFDMHDVMGHKGLYNPYLITKAYNTSPSEVGTLTGIILQVLGDSSTPTDIILSYSITASASDFIEFKRYTDYIFSEDIENLDIPVPTAIIANAHHYRLKIEVDGYMELYNIERRFRVRGRTR